MFLGKLFTKTLREAPYVPVGETLIAPTLLPACCACGLVQDKAGATPDLERWISQRTYRETHGVNPAELALTDTYCPTCFAKVQEMMRQYWQKSRAVWKRVKKLGSTVDRAIAEPLRPYMRMEELIALGEQAKEARRHDTRDPLQALKDLP